MLPITRTNVLAGQDIIMILMTHLLRMNHCFTVDDWVAPVKPVQSQQAWLHAAEQEAMLEDMNDEWADKAEGFGPEDSSKLSVKDKQLIGAMH